jgi:hypothetical protein
LNDWNIFFRNENKSITRTRLILNSTTRTANGSVRSKNRTEPNQIKLNNNNCLKKQNQTIMIYRQTVLLVQLTELLSTISNNYCYFITFDCLNFLIAVVVIWSSFMYKLLHFSWFSHIIISISWVLESYRVTISL